MTYKHTIISGPPKSGKTWEMLRLACAAAIQQEGQRVLVSCSMPIDMILERVKAILQDAWAETVFDHVSRRLHFTNGSAIMFDYIATKEAAYRHAGAAYQTIGMDGPIDPLVAHYMGTRLRRIPKKGIWQFMQPPMQFIETVDTPEGTGLTVRTERH